VIGDRIDVAAIGTVEIAAQLQVVGRISEHQINRWPTGSERIASMQSPGKIRPSGRATRQAEFFVPIFQRVLRRT
jgi:hypothetical protein